MTNNKTYQPMAFYLGQPWSYLVDYTPDPEYDENYTIRIKELPGCMTHGTTPVEAFQNIYDAIESYIQGLMADQAEIPLPVNPKDFKGQFSVRTTAEKHYRIDRLAKIRRTTMNKLINEALDRLLDDAG